MKEPRDVIKQIITNEPYGWDQADDMSFAFYDAEVKGVVYHSVFIDFSNGKVTCYDMKDVLLKTYYIEATLHECP